MPLPLLLTNIHISILRVPLVTLKKYINIIDRRFFELFLYPKKKNDCPSLWIKSLSLKIVIKETERKIGSLSRPEMCRKLWVYSRNVNILTFI